MVVPDNYQLSRYQRKSLGSPYYMGHSPATNHEEASCLLIRVLIATGTMGHQDQAPNQKSRKNGGEGGTADLRIKFGDDAAAALWTTNTDKARTR